MSRRPVTHGTVEQSRRSASAIIARAYLFKADADAQKRIDRYIDYFGGTVVRRSVVTDPCGESLLEADSAR